MKGGPEDNILDKESWMAQWVDLVTQLVQYAPEAHGRLLLDLINEPDGCVQLLFFPGRPTMAGSADGRNFRQRVTMPWYAEMECRA